MYYNLKVLWMVQGFSDRHMNILIKFKPIKSENKFQSII